MTWLKAGATHYHAQLRLPDKSHAIKGLVAIVCYSMTKTNDLWDGSMDQPNVRCLVDPCCGQNVYRTQVPQHPKKYIF